MNALRSVDCWPPPHRCGRSPLFMTFFVLCKEGLLSIPIFCLLRFGLRIDCTYQNICRLIKAIVEVVLEEKQMAIPRILVAVVYSPLHYRYHTNIQLVGKKAWRPRGVCWSPWFGGFSTSWTWMSNSTTNMPNFSDGLLIQQYSSVCVPTSSNNSTTAIRFRSC
jgi:hypothetical protein